MSFLNFYVPINSELFNLFQQPRNIPKKYNFAFAIIYTSTLVTYDLPEEDDPND